MRLGKVFSVLMFGIFFLVDSAWAAEEAAAGSSDWSAAAGGLGIAMAAFGGAMGQSRAVSAALEGIGRNPGAAGQMFVPMLLGLAFMESLVIFSFVIAYNLTK
ncbi:MAG: ATP synthase F0 subunit C [Deltaproteobacteria bacterium]|nr:ATP synthase F0 subunit C [Deltaproteobacteria bacterium]